MNRKTRCTLRYAAAFVAMLGCSKTHDAGACPGGEPFERAGALFCYYESGITETGFSCPAAVPHQHDLPEGGTVCSAQNELPPEVPEFIEREFYASNNNDPEDAAPRTDVDGSVLSPSDGFAESCPELAADPNFGDPSMRWVTKGACLKVTYAPEFADHVGQLRAAVDAWRGLTCNQLCIEGPEPRDSYALIQDQTRPENVWDGTVPEPRVHFHVVDDDVVARFGVAPDLAPTSVEGPSDVPALTFLEHAVDTGQIFTATILFRDAPSEATEPSLYTHEFGHALGFSHAREDTDSIMSAYPDTPSALTEADEASYCAMYGENPWCEP